MSIFYLLLCACISLQASQTNPITIVPPVGYEILYAQRGMQLVPVGIVPTAPSAALGNVHGSPSPTHLTLNLGYSNANVNNLTAGQQAGQQANPGQYTDTTHLTDNHPSHVAQQKQEAQTHTTSEISTWRQAKKQLSDLSSNFSFKSLLTSKYGWCAYAGCGLSMYGWCWWNISKTKSVLSNPDSWCNWKIEYSLEELFNHSRPDLLKELLSTIYLRYSTHHELTDHTTALNAFLEQCSYELMLFKRYFTLYTWVHRLHIQRLLPFNEKDLLILKTKIERLAYLKSIFFSWAADYKTARCLHIKTTIAA